MSRLSTRITLCALIAVVSLPLVANAQRRGVPRPPSPPQHGVVLRGHVFIGGYFHDPFFGPYPWWSRTAYPYWYFPVYDQRAELRISATPEEAAVYVEGRFVVQVPAGKHHIEVSSEGYRQFSTDVEIRDGETMPLNVSLMSATS